MCTGTPPLCPSGPQEPPRTAQGPPELPPHGWAGGPADEELEYGLQEPRAEGKGPTAASEAEATGIKRLSWLGAVSSPGINSTDPAGKNTAVGPWPSSGQPWV